jgi:hypothetical protein
MHRVALTALLFLFGGTVLAGPCAAQVTVDEAKMFFKSFDNQAMTGRGGIAGWPDPRCVGIGQPIVSK